MYPVILAIHNILRWAVIILGILVLVQAYIGFLGNGTWSDRDRKIGVFFSSLLDLQLLFGLILYLFLSNITRIIFTDFQAAISGEVSRFFTLEHAIFMILAVIFAHLGTILPRRIERSKDKYARAAIWFTLSFLVLMLGIPWSRPLLP